MIVMEVYPQRFQVYQVKNQLAELQGIVGGDIEMLGLTATDVMLVQEGPRESNDYPNLLATKMYQRMRGDTAAAIHGGVIRGQALVVGQTPDFSDFCDMGLVPLACALNLFRAGLGRDLYEKGDESTPD